LGIAPANEKARRSAAGAFWCLYFHYSCLREIVGQEGRGFAVSGPDSAGIVGFPSVIHSAISECTGDDACSEDPPGHMRVYQE